MKDRKNKKQKKKTTIRQCGFCTSVCKHRGKCVRQDKKEGETDKQTEQKQVAM